MIEKMRDIEHRLNDRNWTIFSYKYESFLISIDSAYTRLDTHFYEQFFELDQKILAILYDITDVSKTLGKHGNDEEQVKLRHQFQNSYENGRIYQLLEIDLTKLIADESKKKFVEW